MPITCSVSRSVEEAQLDPEWPGPPLSNFRQTTLFEKPQPRAPRPLSPSLRKRIKKRKKARTQTVYQSDCGETD